MTRVVSAMALIGRLPRTGRGMTGLDLPFQLFELTHGDIGRTSGCGSIGNAAGFGMHSGSLVLGEFFRTGRNRGRAARGIASQIAGRGPISWTELLGMFRLQKLALFLFQSQPCLRQLIRLLFDDFFFAMPLGFPNTFFARELFNSLLKVFLQ